MAVLPANESDENFPHQKCYCSFNLSPSHRSHPIIITCVVTYRLAHHTWDVGYPFQRSMGVQALSSSRISGFDVCSGLLQYKYPVPLDTCGRRDIRGTWK
jgi:hypothetical protein